MNPRALKALTLARLRELAREPGTLFWAFGFPLLLSLGLGLAFREPAPGAAGGSAASAPGHRYIDFLVPGLVGMNVMSGSMWTLAYAVVSLRVRKLMKRLLATPLRRQELFASFVLARLVVLPVEMAVLLAVTHVIFGVPLHGSLVLLFAVAVLGCLSFGGVATLVASRAPNVETATGLMNAVMIPMFVASGVFFPTSRFPAAAQPFLARLPLSLLNDALRAILLEGAGLSEVLRPCLALTAWGVLAGLVGLRRFRWT